MALKHPMQHEWTFWHFKQDSNVIWTDKWHHVLSVQTVEDFWAVYNWIALPSQLQTGSGRVVTI